MKKLFALVLAAVMALSVCSFASAEADGFKGEIKVWVADAMVDLTNQL